MRNIIYALTLIMLIGCGGDCYSVCEGGGEGVEQPLTIITRNENNATFTVTEGALNGQYELQITGSGNTITIANNQNIVSLRFIGGSNNLVTFPPQTSRPGLHFFLWAITSTGSDNTIFVPKEWPEPIPTADLGNGDQIIYYD